MMDHQLRGSKRKPLRRVHLCELMWEGWNMQLKRSMCTMLCLGDPRDSPPVLSRIRTVSHSGLKPKRVALWYLSLSVSQHRIQRGSRVPRPVKNCSHARCRCCCFFFFFQKLCEHLLVGEIQNVIDRQALLQDAIDFVERRGQQ